MSLTVFQHFPFYEYPFLDKLVCVFTFTRPYKRVHEKAINPVLKDLIEESPTMHYIE